MIHMKKHLLSILAFLIVISCHQEPVLDPGSSREVSVEAVVSKTTLDGDEVVWESKDKIAMLFSRDGKNEVSVFSSQLEEGMTSAKAKFTGSIKSGVTLEAGYEEIGYVVYPDVAVSEGGEIDFTLPSEQTSEENGSFQSGIALSSSQISLSDVVDDGHAEVKFLNSMSILRIALSEDVRSVTIEGSAPLSGKVPMVFDDDGRLILNMNGEFDEASSRVVLKPADGLTFRSETYNVLVWPGKQESLSATLNFNELGDYTKKFTVSTVTPVTLLPSRYYNLDINSTEELVVSEVAGRLEDLENSLPDLDELEGDVADLLSRIQSVSLMTEYLDNSAYAPYGNFNVGMQKMDVTLNYIVKPESAAQALIEAFKSDPSIVSGVLTYSKSSGFEVSDKPLAVKNLVLSETAGFGKYVTASIDASDISKDFYDGKYGASVALNITSGKTDIMSDFANLVPKADNAFWASFVKDIPVIPGAGVVIPFSFALADHAAPYSLEIDGYENLDAAYVNYNKDFRTGNLTVYINGTKPIQSQNVTLSLIVGSGNDTKVISNTFSFVDSGSRIDLVDPGVIDFIGGEVVVDVKVQNVSNYILSCSGAGVSQSGNVFTFSENTGAERTVTVECQANIPNVSLNFYKSITLTQRAAGTDLTKQYYSNGQKIVLSQATSNCANKFNIVILGDGYQKKDLAVGGKFERSAKSVMDSFFAIEPYKTFKDRFNVYMVTYQSDDEGTDIRSTGVTKNTYFNSYCQGGGNTAAYVDEIGANRVISAVKNVAGSADAQYYRSIAILLLNTDEQAGSTGYPYREMTSGWPNGYASFSIAVLAANSSGTNGLVKHEAGGHAFGRLADEYYSGSNAASSSNKNDLSNWHKKGWYWNVNPTNSGNYYMFTNSSYSSEVGFIEGAWGYAYGIYRPTQGGMMQSNTGVFNAPSRHAIYHRIITESEGTNAYSWSKFLEYDRNHN